MGYVRELDLLAALAALEISLYKLGWEIELGTGINKAQTFILNKTQKGIKGGKQKTSYSNRAHCRRRIGFIAHGIGNRFSRWHIPEELLDIIGQYDAIIVRSVTKVNEELISRGVPA